MGKHRLKGPAKAARRLPPIRQGTLPGPADPARPSRARPRAGVLDALPRMRPCRRACRERPELLEIKRTLQPTPNAPGGRSRWVRPRQAVPQPDAHARPTQLAVAQQRRAATATEAASRSGFAGLLRPGGAVTFRDVRVRASPGPDGCPVVPPRQSVRHAALGRSNCPTNA